MWSRSNRSEDETMHIITKYNCLTPLFYYMGKRVYRGQAIACRITTYFNENKLYTDIEYAFRQKQKHHIPFWGTEGKKIEGNEAEWEAEYTVWVSEEHVSDNQKKIFALKKKILKEAGGPS